MRWGKTGQIFFLALASFRGRRVVGWSLRTSTPESRRCPRMERPFRSNRHECRARGQPPFAPIRAAERTFLTAPLSCNKLEMFPFFCDPPTNANRPHEPMRVFDGGGECWTCQTRTNQLRDDALPGTALPSGGAPARLRPSTPTIICWKWRRSCFAAAAR